MNEFKDFWINDKTCHILCPEYVFVTLFIGEDKALLLDTGYGIYDLKAHIENITNLPIIVVNSHGHVDHVNGNYQFEKAYIHSFDLTTAEIHTSQEMRKQGLDVIKMFHVELPQEFNVEQYLNHEKGSFVSMQEEQSFDLGNYILDVVSIPGHTKGCIGLLDNENKILYSGDSLNFFAWLFAPEESTSINSYLGSIKNTMKLDFEYFVISHKPDKFKKERLEEIYDCAANIVVNKSQKYETPFWPGKELLLYSKEGKQLDNVYTDSGDPDYVGIVYLPEKLG